MRQRTMTQPNQARNQASSQALNSTLQNVLGCLDVQLETELIRYRRQKAKQKAKGSGAKDSPLGAVDLNAFRSASAPRLALAPTLHPELDPSQLLDTALDLTPPPTVGALPEPQASAVPRLPEESRVSEGYGRSPLPLDPHLTLDYPLEPLDLDSLDSVAVDPNSAALDATDLEPAQWYVLTDPPEQIQVDITLLDSPEGVKALQSFPWTPKPYVVVTESYTCPAIEFAPEDASSESSASELLEPTALEESGLDSQPADPDLLPDLPPELSDAELQSLVSPGAIDSASQTALAPLAIEDAPTETLEYEAEYGDDPWSVGNMTDYDESSYGITDADDPWPDELDEEPRDLAIAEIPEGELQWIDLESDKAIDRLDSSHEQIHEEITGEANTDSVLSLSPEETPPRSLPPAPLNRLVPVGGHLPPPLKPVGSALDLAPATGYLASSEALLEDLEDEEEGGKNWLSNLSGLFTPVGIGSALLLMFSALAVSVVLLNPEWVSHWKMSFAKLAHPKNETVPQPVPSVQPSGGSNPANPYNVSSQQFLNLDLGNLSQVKPQIPNSQVPSSQAPNPQASGLPSPLASASPGVPSSQELFPTLRQTLNNSGQTDRGGTSNDVGSAPAAPETPAPQPERQVQPQPYVAPPAPRITDRHTDRPVRSAPVAAKAPVTPPKIEEPAPPVSAPAAPKPVQNYSVITPYTSDKLLDQSQSVVPDAYLQNTDTGANIQFGVFNDANSADALADKLKAQGIPAQVVPAQ